MPKATRIINWRYRRQRRARRGGRVWLRLIAALLALLLVLVVGVSILSAVGVGAAYTFLTGDLPDYRQIETLQTQDVSFETTKIYAQGGDPDGDGIREWVLIYEVIDPLGGDRQWVTLDQLPQHMVDATVAIEDKSYWTNEGYDAEGIGRAFYEYVWLGGEIQGGSSITQQLVKNTLIPEERRQVGAEVGLDDYRRKFEEIVLANQVAQAYSKEQILEWYLNTNFYGNLAYGIEAAARVYFDKPASQLTLPEAAMLAAIPQSPALNPIDNPQAAKARQELVLDALFREGYIDGDQLVAARFTPLQLAAGIEDRFDIIAPHYALYVRKQLEERFGTAAVLRGGLKVYTALDLEMQQQAECVARAQVSRLSGDLGAGLPADELSRCPALEFLQPLRTADAGADHNVSNAAVVMLDPRTGELKAMVGSLDYWDETIDGSFNVAADGLRQPGSAFKPFTYLTALSQGYTAATMVLDVETDFGTEYNGVPYVPQNYDRKFHGPMSLRSALANSYNVPAVEVMSWVGVGNVIRTAHQMGITSLDDSQNQYGLSLTLGGGEVKLIDMAYAFSVLANGGVMVGEPIPEAQQRAGFRSVDPVTILRVEGRDGTVLYEYQQPTRREILTPQLAYLMNHILSDRRARCAGFGCPNALELPDGRPVAAKTGTTNDFRDGWTVGYTPQLVTAVWLGNSDNAPMDDVPGSRGAAPIWQALMQWALQDEEPIGWQRPPGIVERAVCTPSGLLDNGQCPATTELFIEGTAPVLFDTMYQTFKLNRETGRLATVDTPPELIEEKTFVIYPERAADWVRENGIEQPPTEYDTLAAPKEGESPVRIDRPRPFEYHNTLVQIFGTTKIDDFAYYRLAFFEGLTPEDLITIADNITEPKENELLGWLDTSQIEGLYTILLTVVRQDGTFEEVSVPITVDRTPPTILISAPFEGQTVAADEEYILVRADATDDISIKRVEFFADSAAVPFAISTVPPYTERWRIAGGGCHAFRAVAIDAAGNEVESAAVRACVGE